jgi:Tat protein translocase TatC
MPLLVASVLLFFIGMAFAYFAFFPMVFGFMAKFAPEGVAWMTDIEKYFSFVLTMFLAFGVTFEVPVIVIVLVKIGMVDVVKLREWRPYVIVGAFVVGAVFTPPDVISQFMMAVPLWLLIRTRDRPGQPDRPTGARGCHGLSGADRRRNEPRTRSCRTPVRRTGTLTTAVV